MSTIQYQSDSFYSLTPQNSTWLDLWVPRDIPPMSDDQIFTIPAIYNCRPDLLATDVYQDPNFLWVFFMRNKDVLLDPIWDFTTGSIIFLTTAPSLKLILNS